MEYDMFFFLAAHIRQVFIFFKAPPYPPSYHNSQHLVMQIVDVIFGLALYIDKHLSAIYWKYVLPHDAPDSRR